MLADIPSLSDSLIHEIVKAFGLPKSSFLNRLFHPFFHRAMDHLAALGSNFDRIVTDHGYAEAARELLAGFCHPLHALGAGNIPAEGPTLRLPA